MAQLVTAATIVLQAGIVPPPAGIAPPTDFAAAVNAAVSWPPSIVPVALELVAPSLSGRAIDPVPSFRCGSPRPG